MCPYHSARQILLILARSTVIGCVAGNATQCWSSRTSQGDSL